MYSKTAEVLGQCLLLHTNKLVCLLWYQLRAAQPAPCARGGGLALKLDKICTQKLPKFLNNVCFYTQISWCRLWYSCVQHSLHPVHVEAVVPPTAAELGFEHFSKQIK
jgi:hypothetical protein